MKLAPGNQMVNFDVQSLYTNVIVEESLHIIQQKRTEDETILKRTKLSDNK